MVSTPAMRPATEAALRSCGVEPDGDGRDRDLRAPGASQQIRPRLGHDVGLETQVP